MKLKTFALALAASTIAGSVLAADLPSRKMAPVFAPTPALTWSGFYVGLNAGATFGGSNTTNEVAVPLVPGAAAAALASAATGSFGAGSGNSSFIGGAQVGWNWQSGAFLAGLETDIQGLVGRRNPSNTAIVLVTTTSLLQTVPGGSRVDWLGTLRGRLGFVASPTWLLYATGGLAYGGVSNANNSVTQISFAGPPLRGVGSGNSFGGTRLGWTAGAGAEWMFARNWSAKIEYLYYDLGTRNSTGVVVDGITGLSYMSYTASQRTNGHIVRAGVNYHFNWGAAPVVAKY